MATERLIRVKDAEDAINRIGNQVKTARGMRVAALMSLCGVPTVDAKPVVHGRWVDRYGGKYANPLYECSECKKPAPTKCEYDVLGSLEWHYDLTPYCPNCGAKKDGGNEDA